MSDNASTKIFKKNTPRQQHYLPKAAYLRHFQRPDLPGSIFLYDRRSAKSQSLNLNKAGRQRDIYTCKNPEGENDYRVETELFDAIDSGLTPLLSRLNAPVPIIQAAPNLILFYGQFIDLCVFTSLQMMRTPPMIQQIEDSIMGLHKEVSRKRAADKEIFHKETKAAMAASNEPEFLNLDDEGIEHLREYIMAGNYDLQAEKSPYFMGTALQLARDIMPILTWKELVLLKAPPNKMFITADYPVLKIPDQSVPQMYRGGILYSQVYLPIGSRTALLFRNGDAPRAPKKTNCIERISVQHIPPYIVDALNQRMLAHAENAVFAGHLDVNIQAILKATDKPKRFTIG